MVAGSASARPSGTAGGSGKSEVEVAMVAATFGVGQVVFTLLWVFAFFVQIWLMVSIFIDVFRSDDLSGLAKAGWVVLVIAVPVIGILAYLIRRGDRMLVHRTQAARDARAQFDHTLQDLVGARRSKADEIARLAVVRDRRDITAEEFEHLKADVIGQEPGPAGDGAQSAAPAGGRVS